MSRRRPPARRWRIGDRCRVPWYRRSLGVGARWYPAEIQGEVGGWHPAEVVAVRGDRVIVRCYGWEAEHPWWELREPPPHRGMWTRWWSHDKRRNRI